METNKFFFSYCWREQNENEKLEKKKNMEGTKNEKMKLKKFLNRFL